MEPLSNSVQLVLIVLIYRLEELAGVGRQGG